MSVGPTRGPVQRPDLDRDLSEIFQRITDLERSRPAGAGARQVYGRIYDDGTIFWAGTGDWTSDNTGGWITVTLDTPFSEGFVCGAWPNDNGDVFAVPPDLQPVAAAGESESGFVQVIQVDLGTFRIMFWDLDGNPNVNRCGFDFEAVGT